MARAWGVVPFAPEGPAYLATSVSWWTPGPPLPPSLILTPAGPPACRDERPLMPTDLHLALQQHYAGADGAVEALVEGYRADALRDGVIYEIQTGAFGSIRDKLRHLLRKHPVVLVYPVPARKVIVYVDGEGREVSSRRSPRRGALTDVFMQLLHLHDLPGHRRLSLEIVLIHERELRRRDGMGSWRRQGVSLVGRELVEIVEVRRFDHPRELAALLPDDLPRDFTVAELREALKLRQPLAGRMAYALWKLGVVKRVGKRGNAHVYRRVGKGTRPAAPDQGEEEGAA